MRYNLRKYGVQAPKKPYNVIVIGDFAKDLDDEHVLCGLAGLVKLGFVTLKCVVGNLAPAQLRALAAKGTLNMLDLKGIPVGIGTAVYEGKQYPYEAAIPYLAGISEVDPDGEALLVRTLESCDDSSVVLVLQSGLTDAAILLRNHEALFVQKIHHVAIMGGVERTSNSVVLDEMGMMKPDNANNNSFDPVSAEWLHRRLQEVGVPMIITTREVAYAAQVPFAAYNQFEETGNPVGACLKNRQMPALQHLWEAACSPAGSEIRGTLPADRDRSWFVKVFCAGIDPGIADGAEVWPFVGCFNLYDPSNFYAAIPELLEKFLDPYEVVVNGVKHLVIGVSKEMNGVKDVVEFGQFMVEIEVFGLQK